MNSIQFGPLEEPRARAGARLALLSMWKHVAAAAVTLVGGAQVSKAGAFGAGADDGGVRRRHRAGVRRADAAPHRG